MARTPKTDRIYEETMSYLSNAVRIAKPNLMHSPNWDALEYWAERQTDAREATQEYLDVADRIGRTSGTGKATRITQGIEFLSPLNCHTNYPIGRIFLGNTRTLEANPIMSALLDMGWDVGVIEAMVQEKDNKNRMAGSEEVKFSDFSYLRLYGKNPETERRIEAHIGRYGLKRWGLMGDFRDFIKEGFGKLSKDLGVIIG